MKPLLFRITATENESFKVQVDEQPRFYNTLHFHPEWQITLILRSTGTLFAGDNIDLFLPFDIYLLGSNLPHVFRNDSINEDNAYSISIFFRKDLFGNDFYKLPETFYLNELLEEASRGIRIRNLQSNDLTDKIKDFSQKQGLKRLIVFLDLLNDISTNPNKELLSSVAYQYPKKVTDNQRINTIFGYLMTNYTREIPLEEIAEVANLTPNAFCRFFKLCTQKTFSDFLNDIRIGHACKLLTEQRFPVTIISFSCGFNNISNFNRQFKRRMKMTPTQYLQKFRTEK